jgi:glycosyltransferase involved in cell wall biosynthesis
MFLLQNKKEITRDSLNGFGDVSIFSPSSVAGSSKNKLRKIQDSLNYRYLTKQYFRSADSVFLELLPYFRAKLRTEKYNVILFEHIQSMRNAIYFRKFLPDALFILDDHNVDHLLLEEENRKHAIPGFKERYKNIISYESNLKKYVDALWVCSENDREVFKKLNGAEFPVAVIPNGVDTTEKQLLDSKGDDTVVSLLFCGDLNYTANRSGVTWFLDRVWPLLQKSEFKFSLTIVGNGSEQKLFEGYKRLAGVLFKGRVNHLEEVYAASTLSIAPLTVGSGTRLKILESLSYGVPAVVTNKAAEGVPYKDGVHLMLADDESEFYNKILTVVKDRQLYQSLKENGRKFVELNYDWNVIGRKMTGSLSVPKLIYE